jgi:hypothetical protein
MYVQTEKKFWKFNYVGVFYFKEGGWAGRIAHAEEKRNAYKVLVGKYEEKRRLGRSRYKWEDNIKLDFKDIGWKCVDWIQRDQDKDQRGAFWTR